MTNPEFKLPPHLDLLDVRLVDFISEVARKSEATTIPRHPGESRRGPRLMVFMPPRHGKSLLTSQYAPAWALLCHPRMRVILASYQSGLPGSWAKKVREIIEEDADHLFDTGISPKTTAASEWETTEGGTMMARGVGGGITGRGAELLFIDDPIKDQEQAMSVKIRQKAWDWWISTARPRLQPGAGVVVIMTRWHEDDLAGRLLAQDKKGDGEGWEVIRYPGIAEPELDEHGVAAPNEDGSIDDLGRKPGEALWPAMYDVEYLEQTKRVSGTYWFTAMYQQRPGPSEGAILKREWLWENLYTPYKPPQLKEVCQSWDLTFDKGEGQDGSWTVGQVWASDLADRYLLAQIRARLDFTETIAAMLAMTKFIEAQGWSTQGKHRIYVEKAANGAAILSALKSKLQGLIAVQATDSKEQRVHAISPQVEAGNVHLPRDIVPCPPGYDATRTESLIEELVNFPLGMSDDQVDAMTQALAKMGKGKKTGARIRSGGYDH